MLSFFIIKLYILKNITLTKTQSQNELQKKQVNFKKILQKF